MKKILIGGMIIGVALGIAGVVTADTTNRIDIGDTTSETTYAAEGWGPVKSGWGGNSDNFKVIWEPDGGACLKDDNWASVTLPNTASGESIISLTIRHLDGRADDSFKVYINGVEIDNHVGTPGVETWETTIFPVSEYYLASDAIITLEATASAWSLCGTYGQVAIDWIDVTTADVTAPTDPVVLGFLNPNLPCSAITNASYITVDWSDSTDASGIAGYEYFIDYPTSATTWGQWTTFKTSSQHSGSLNEGTHYVKVRAKDNAGNYSEWSNTCSITADWTAPVVTIEAPVEGDLLNGIVDIYGTIVEDVQLSHYNIAIYEGGDNYNDFSLRLEQETVYRTDGFSNEMIYQWDTTSYDDGEYQIRLAARDAAGNRVLLGGEPLAGDDSQHVITVNVDNTAPEITLMEPVNESIHHGTIHLKAECNEMCDYVNFWWRHEDEAFSSVSKRYHYVHTNGTIFEWNLNPDNAELWDGGDYVMEDGVYYFYAAGKDLTGNWAKTATHKIYLDKDNDGVAVGDFCPDTDYDDHWFSYDTLGVNRWEFTADGWITRDPKGKGNVQGPKAGFEIADTYGCSCTQILDRMKEATGEEFGGHYKFGCSKSILEDWIAGEYYLETVEVPANDADGVESLMSPINGQDYFLKASGTAFACDQPGCVIEFDAEYSTSDLGLNWVDGVAAPYSSYGLDLLDLKVDGGFVDWGTYNLEHKYQHQYMGTGNPLSLLVYDLAGSYFNDTGSLYVDIFAKLW